MTEAEQTILNSLQSSRYLTSVPEDSLRSFLPLIRYQHFPVGMTPIRQGETNREVYILLSGSVSVSTDGRELYRLSRNGDIFGEITVVSGEPSPATVTVVESLEALVVSAMLLQEVKDDNSHKLSFLFYDWISRILADKLWLTSEKAKRFEDASAELRRSLEAQQRMTEDLQKATAALERSKAELEELNKLKTELIGIASHDLRSPISSVITLMETIPNCYELDQELIELLREVKETCNEQLTLVNSLLDLARIESGRLELEPAPLSHEQLLDIFRQIERRARLLSHSKQLEVRLEIANTFHAKHADERPVISCDAPKIQQVANNLVGNAIKFTPDRGRVTLQLETLDNRLQVSVSDTGPGIPAAELERIFDKFHQVKTRNTGTRGEKGTGLGLSICRNMIELHGGQIWAESVEGQGTTFRFTLPLAAG